MKIVAYLIYIIAWVVFVFHEDFDWLESEDGIFFMLVAIFINQEDDV